MAFSFSSPPLSDTDSQDVDKFLLLGQAKDPGSPRGGLAPGEVFDKVARRLRLQTLDPRLRDASGKKIN